ncbi:Soyasapogenol B glucuronide galactosyltransferase [Glycine max]|nr:Soyasapogenol B glucuronide galactosyltransferase [Glycine max]
MIMESFGEAAEILKAIFLPFISTSHLIPLVDIARLFAMHGVGVTVISISANAAIFQSSIDSDSTRGRSIRTHLVKFPPLPDFIVTDMFYPWTADAAADLGIPRLVYVGGASYVAHWAMNCVEQFALQTKVDSDGESFVLPGLA